MGAEKSVPVQAGTTFTSVTLDAIAVTNGQAEIGVTSSGQTVLVDDFTLTAR